MYNQSSTNLATQLHIHNMSTFNIVQLNKIFNKLDRDGDGLVSVDELKWLLDAFSVCSDRDEIELLIGEKKSLSYTDFLFFCETLSKGDDVFDQEIREIDHDDESDLQKAFKVFDLDQDGFISCEDLGSALSRLGLWDEKHGQDCKGMISVYDTNSDGLVDFEEFKNMMSEW